MGFPDFKIDPAMFKEKVRHYECHACASADETKLQQRPCKMSGYFIPLDLENCPVDGDTDCAWVEV